MAKEHQALKMRITTELTAMKVSAFLFLVPVVAALTGCGLHSAPDIGPVHEEPVAVQLGQTERANVELNMGAGELAVRGGATQLLEGHFEYNVPDWKPKVHSSNIGTHATVTIEQPEHTGFGGPVRYRWDLRLSDKALLELALNCGAGQAELSLGDLRLRSLDVKMGAGQVNLDLRGTPARDYEVNISGGVGQATVHLPANVGVFAEAHGGIGSVNVSGLDKVGDHYENSLYDKAKVSIRLKVHGGIGQINIIGS